MRNYSLQPKWYWESGFQFRLTNKKLFYAACYHNNAQAQVIAIDFFYMYLMGGEL